MSRFWQHLISNNSGDESMMAAAWTKSRIQGCFFLIVA